MNAHLKMNRFGGHTRAFTLMEVLLATLVFATILAALNAVFFGALRLHKQAMEIMDDRFPREYAARIIKRDLAGVIGSTGRMATNFVGQSEGSGRVRLDTIEFCTTTGSSGEALRRGDIQRVQYFLTESLQNPLLTREILRENPDSRGLLLVRSVYKDLLSQVTPEPTEEFLMSNVDSMQLAYYDKTEDLWLDQWDSELLNEGEVPAAVRFSIQFVASLDRPNEVLQPLEWVVPIQTTKLFDYQTLETAVQTETADSGENQNNENQEGNNNGGETNGNNNNNGGNNNSGNPRDRGERGERGDRGNDTGQRGDRGNDTGQDQRRSGL